MSFLSFTLNIGLEPSKKTRRKAHITKPEILAALRAAGFHVRYYRVEPENKPLYEATAIVVVEPVSVIPAEFYNAIYRVSAALAQDCIAARNNVTAHGQLIGPDAADWGEFDPAYFIEYTTFTDIAA